MIYFNLFNNDFKFKNYNAVKMLKQRGIQQKEHRRNNSQIDLFYPDKTKTNISDLKSSKSKKNKERLKLSQGKTKKIGFSSLKENQTSKPNEYNHQNTDVQRKTQIQRILKLVRNSDNTLKDKSIVIERIDQKSNHDQNIDTSNGSTYSNPEKTSLFFQFGNHKKAFLNKQYALNLNDLDLNMEQIQQVPDTMSNQRRYQYQPAQNNSIHYGKDQKLKMLKLDGPSMRSSLQQKKKNNIKIDNQSFLNFKKNYKRKSKFSKDNVVTRKQDFNDFDFTDFMQTQKKKTSLKNQTQTSSKVLKSKNNKSKDKFTFRDQEKRSLLSTKNSKTLSHSQLLKYKSKSKDKISQQKIKSKSLVPSCQQLLVKKNKSTIKIRHSATLKKDKSKKRNSQPHSYHNQNHLEQKINKVDQKTNKLQNQYNLLQECVGELWQNGRIARYISQKNKNQIDKLLNKQEQTDYKLILLKNQILKSISSARY